MISILCQECGEHYKAEYSTIKLNGPVVHVNCPFCKHESCKSFSRFAEIQAKREVRSNRFALVTYMIGFSRKLEGEIN